MNPSWLNVILRNIKENVRIIHPQVPFTVVCTCRVYNTVLWLFSWWYLYFCKHFGDLVISGFYKPQLFLKFSLTHDSFFCCFTSCWQLWYKCMHTRFAAPVARLFLFSLCRVLTLIYHLDFFLCNISLRSVCTALWSPLSHFLYPSRSEAYWQKVGH